MTLDSFVKWLLGKQSQTELGVSSARTWRRNRAWCWKIIFKATLTGEVYPIILVDCTLVDNLVCLIARIIECVIRWHWAGWDSSNTWSELLEQLPAPVVEVCYGQKGILAAVGRCWPSTVVQCCHFHIWQNIS